jgi:hypothetical protein
MMALKRQILDFIKEERKEILNKPSMSEDYNCGKEHILNKLENMVDKKTNARWGS